MEYTVEKAIKEIYMTEAGKYLFGILKAVYVDPSVMSDTDRMTMYLTGQKELIQGLLMHTEDRPKIETINTSEYTDD